VVYNTKKNRSKERQKYGLHFENCICLQEWGEIRLVSFEGEWNDILLREWAVSSLSICVMGSSKLLLLRDPMKHCTFQGVLNQLDRCYSVTQNGEAQLVESYIAVYILFIYAQF
jgi:hypothetical protein